MKQKKMKPIAWVAVSLILILVSCIGASLIQTDFGSVTITDVRLPMPDGETLRVLVHRPAAATPENPAPAVITSHGYHATLETQDITSIELARRGFVVFNMDTYSAGSSSGTTIPYNDSRSYYGLGMLQLVDYVHDNIDYVDPERIGITGHSTGGRNVAFTLDAYGRNEHGLDYAGQPDDAGDYETKVSSALILAFFPGHYLLNNMPSGVNVGINFARYDEGTTVQVTKVDGYQWPDMTVSPEAKFFINTTTPGAFALQADAAVDPQTGHNDVTLSGWDNSEKVETGKYYGSIEDGTMRVVYNPPTSHQWQFFSKQNATITNQFFMDTLGAPNPITADDQVWFWKEVLNAVGLAGFFLLLIPLATLLMQTPFFGTLLQPAGPARPAPVTARGKAVFAVSLILLAVLPGLTVMPAFSDIAYGMIFTNAATNNSTDFFPQPGPNAIIVWAVLNAVLAALIFAAGYFIDGKKSGDSPSKWGLRTSWANVGKSLLLAFIVMVCAYSTVLFADRFFKTDFRFWSFAVRAADGNILALWLHYVPFMLVFWLVTSFMVNVSARVQTKKPWVNTAMCVVVNTIGLIGLCAVQFFVLFTTGVAAFYVNRAWVNICLIIPFIPMMAIGTVVLRKAYQRTGTIYLGAFLMAFISTLVSVSTANAILFV
ncbi:MAG: hypothetical protein DBY17_07330 [Oscillospiraceae bacterium]|nr:MAG: hypothetical protein DBY17_07330 [Oscillospiraceae bacterium]